MNFARLQTTTLGLLATASLGLAACSGGGSASAPTGIAPPVATAPPATSKSSATKLGVTLAGTSQVYARLHRLAIEGTPISVAYNGATVGTGTLDKNGFAELTFTQAVPAGATVVATIGSGTNALVASIVLASAIPATASLVTYNPGPPPSLHVAAAEDQNGNGQYNVNAPENEEADEDAHTGQISVVVSNNQALPANLPITVAVCGTTITIGLNTTSSPPPSGTYALEVKERTLDDESRGEQEYHFEPFTSPVTIMAATSESRIQIELMQNGNEILKLKAPLSAFTPQSGTPSSCPTTTATASPTATASASASPTASASPSASPTATVSASASPTATATATNTASASPSASPTARPT